jgi:hypothetical protein
MALAFLGSAVAFAFFDAGGSTSTDAVLTVGFSIGAAYGLFPNRAVGGNWRAYVEARREGRRWGHFLEVLYPTVRGSAER